MRDGEPVAFSEFDEPAPRSPEWFPAMAAALAAHGIAPSGLDAIVVGTGPGSFSGIRAVLAAAQGLALPAGVPVWGVLSSSAIAVSRRGAAQGGRIAVVGDARKGCAWLAMHDFGADPSLKCAAPRLVAYADFAGEIASLGSPAIFSPDAARLASVLPAPSPKIEPAAPTAPDVARVFMECPSAAVRDPVPAYLHPAVTPPR